MAKKRSESRTRRAIRSLSPEAVGARQGGGVKGGGKKGDKPVKYLEFKLKEVLISG